MEIERFRVKLYTTPPLWSSVLNMLLTIKFLGALRHISGKTQLTLSFQDGASIQTVVETLCQELPTLKHTFSDSELNNARSNSLILVNGREISVLDGYETQLCDGDEIVFVPVVHGG
jgi:molybdopterin synthase sulfur carrier subunit